MILLSSKPMLYVDFGILKMKNRIIQRKLNLLHHLVNLPDNTLAKEILNAQITFKFPGLFEECMRYIKDLSLPDITIQKIDKNSWKNQVKSAIKELNKKEVKKELEGSRKGEEFIDEEYGTKEYFRTLSLHVARTIFKKGSKMTQHVKMNFPSDEHYRIDLWKCDSCQ